MDHTEIFFYINSWIVILLFVSKFIFICRVIFHPQEVEYNTLDGEEDVSETEN